MLVPRRLLFKDEIFDLEHVSASFKVNWKRKLTPRIVYIRDLSKVSSMRGNSDLTGAKKFTSRYILLNSKKIIMCTIWRG